MPDPMTDARTDAQSLAEYSRTRSAEAMGILVRRYVGLVYATARRLVLDAHLAEDVTQAAFIILVKKANRIDPATLPGWLVNTTRLAARAAIKSKRTRSQYETRAAQMRTEAQAPKEEPTADELLPVLDDALAKLSDADRTAVVMRFLQGRSFAEVGEAMGSSEEAARKRVGRAVEKLRSIFMKQGLAPSVGGLMVVLAAQQAPPAAAAVAAGVMGALSTGGTGTSAAIAKGVISIMKWGQIKLVAVLAVFTVITASVGVSIVGLAKAQQAPDAETGSPAIRASSRRTSLLTSLPEELIRIGRENSISLSKLSCFVAKVDRIEHFSKDGQVARFEERVMITADGKRVRVDTEVVPNVGAEPQSIRVPMANGVAEIIEAPAPSRAIRGVDKFITFFPDEPSVSIIPGDADAPFGENASPIHAYLTVEGKKVETKIAELARTGYFPTESDATVDGVDCKLLDWRFPKEKIELKLWIATSQGSLIKRYQEFYNQQLMHEVNVSLALFGGAFALSAVEDSSWQEGKLQKRTSYMVQSLDLKAKVDAITLSPADLGIPSGCIVQDRLAGTEYRYKP